MYGDLVMDSVPDKVKGKKKNILPGFWGVQGCTWFNASSTGNIFQNGVFINS